MTKRIEYKATIFLDKVIIDKIRNRSRSDVSIVVSSKEYKIGEYKLLKNCTQIDKHDMTEAEYYNGFTTV